MSPYQLELNRLINSLKLDPNANPKWRNKIVSRLEEVDCMMPRLDSREMSKAELGNLEQHNPQALGIRNNCTCDRPGLPPMNPSCPQHGL